MQAIFWLILPLVVVAVVGHTIWVVAASCVRALANLGKDPPRRPRPALVCPRCGEVWDEINAASRCVFCGWSTSGAMSPARPDPQGVLAHLRRRVEHFQRLGLIDAALRDHLWKALQQPGTVTAAPAPAAAAAPQPKPAPVQARAVDDRAFFESLEIPPAAPPASAPRPAPAPRPATAPKPAPVPAQAVTPAEAVAARVRKVQAMRDEAGVPVLTPPPAPPHSQRLFRFLAAFLEEKNIRWGELVGGLLIVGCSIALVLSFWSSIAERPFLKFGLFHGVTALLFLLGLHVERSWKLPTTSRGLLIIASLLTPLNFLAVAALSRGPGIETVFGLLGEILAVGVFAALTYRAGRSLTAGNPLALAIGVLVPSALLLVIRRYGGAGSPEAAPLALAALPLIVQNGLTAIVLRRARQGGHG